MIGQEAKKQLELAGAYPDVVIGCTGGGSNFAGLAFPFLADKVAGRELKVIAAEPAACPTLTRGHYGYDFGDTAQLAPLLPMHTLGHGFVPEPIHAGGLRYHGMAPLVSHLVKRGAGRGRRLRPERVLPRGRPLRPHRGHHAGPGAVARDPRGRGGGRPGQGGGRAARRSSSTCAATGTSTSPPTTRSSPASWRTARWRRTSSTAPPRCWRGCRRPGSRLRVGSDALGGCRILRQPIGGVVQSVRTPACHAGGRGFESRRSRPTDQGDPAASIAAGPSCRASGVEPTGTAPPTPTTMDQPGTGIDLLWLPSAPAATSCG